MTAARPNHTRDFRWPLQPLLDRVNLTAAELGKVKGFAKSSVDDALRDGLSDLQADRWATRLRVHPTQAWPTWDRVALLPSDDLFVNGSDTSGPGWRQAWEWAEAEAVAPTPIDTHRPHRTERRERVA